MSSGAETFTRQEALRSDALGLWSVKDGGRLNLSLEVRGHLYYDSNKFLTGWTRDQNVVRTKIGRCESSSGRMVRTKQPNLGPTHRGGLGQDQTGLVFGSRPASKPYFERFGPVTGSYSLIKENLCKLTVTKTK